MKSITLTLLLLIITAIALKAQASLETKVIPPSPNASALGRFGEIPVGLTTGIPKVGIPIYSYAGISNKLKLNISLDYHAGGIKVEDISSNVGLGWALNAGGVISRTVNGSPDERVNGIRQFPDILPDGIGTVLRLENCLFWPEVGKYAFVEHGGPCNGDLSCLDEGTFQKYVMIQKGQRDAQYDIFNYSFEGYSGQFIIGHDGNTILQMPQTNLIIEPNILNSQFTIITPEGIKYVFKDLEYTQISPCSVCPYVSSWYLSEIVSDNNSDKITFSYNKNSIYYRSFAGQTISINSLTGNINVSFQELNHELSELPTELTLKSIDIPGGINVNFLYTGLGRRDLPGSKALERIIIKSAASEYGYQLSYLYTVADNYGRIVAYNATSGINADYNYNRLRLNSIFKFSSNIQEPPYSFMYDDTYFLPSRNSFAQDHWGFYNGHKENIYLVPRLYVGDIGGDREPDSTYAKASSLKKIVYPTGGSTEFIYEYELGGLRIKKTIDYDGLNDNILTEYGYPTGGNYIHHQYKSTFYELGIKQDVKTTFSNNTMGFYRGSPVTYNTVEVSKKKNGVSNGKTMYIYENQGMYLINDPDPPITGGFPSIPLQYCYWTDGLLKYEIHYSASNQPVKEIINVYDIKINKVVNPIFKSLNVTLVAGPYQESLSGGAIDPWKNSDCSILETDALPPIREFDYAIYNGVHYYPYTGRADLIKTTEINYNSNGSITSETNYEYDQTYYQLKKKDVTDSKDNKVYTEFKYPYDFSSTHPYDTMVLRNIISPVVEKTDKINTTLLQTTKIKYIGWGNNLIAPETVVTIRNDQSDIRTRYKYDKYSGNLLEASKENDANTCYIWGYNQTMPVAEIKNASFKREIVNETINIPWSGNFIVGGPFDIGQTYLMDSSCNLPKPSMVSFERKYFKYDQQETHYLITIYDSYQNEVTHFKDTVTSGNTPFTSVVYLPAGLYTAKASVSLGESPTNGGISVQLSGSIPVIKSVLKTAPYYTGFEDDSLNVSTTHYKTGRKSYSGSYTLKLPACPSGSNLYVLSYWKKASSTAEWAFVTQNITVSTTSGYTKTIGGTGQYIDDVRAYPVNAIMTSYTYDPLYGMTSSTDANNVITHYEYDALGRLKLIKDDDGNILKTYEYHYKQ